MQRLLVASAILLLAACRGTQSSPVAPSATPPSPTAPPSSGPGNIRGVVYEVTAEGRRPLPGAGVDVSPEYQSWPPRLATDADGRFALSAVVGGPTSLKIIATRPHFSQPCRVPAQDAQVDHEVYLVSNDLLSTTGAPSAMPVRGPVLTGRVFERTGDGEQPVAGASITLDFTGGDGWAPSAATITDAAGRYLLCNVVDATRMGIAAIVEKAGYGNVFVQVAAHAGGSFDLELRRQ